MRILGISAYYHDSAAAILQDGVVIAAAQEERFSRIKNDAGFPTEAIRFCLDYSGVRLADLDAVVFYDKPFLKFERLLETYYSFAPRGLVSFLNAMPVWIKEKLFLKRALYKGLKEIEDFGSSRPLLLFPEHHLSHAASAFYPSPFDSAAILVLDAVGEWATVSVLKGEGRKLTILKQLDFPHSLGLLYSAVTYFCGFSVNSGEYKLMGLAPYGNRGGAEHLRLVELVKSRLVDIKEDGSLFLDQNLFDYATGKRMVRDADWEKLFGFPRRKPDGPLEQCYCDLALAIQDVTEEIVLLLATEAKRLTGCVNLCMAGGVALNGVANGKLHGSGIFENIFIQPAAGDAGGALGAAYAAHHIYFGKDRSVVLPDALGGALLGPEFGEPEILAAARRHGCAGVRSLDVASETASLIASGNVVGWFQGRSEFGPRALGSRSILADARDPSMQRKLNLSIKKREGFRPFAPIVMEEDASAYFDLNGVSLYMLLVKKVAASRQVPVPSDFAGWGWMDKLYFKRSDLPAITHVDYSARIQTVSFASNALLWRLLDSFKSLTGCSVLINTSFNVRDEPIVNSPDDAFRCFLQTEMDYLVVGPFIYSKKDYLAKKNES